MTNLYRLAVHESGHCAACIVYGVPIISVTIAADVPHLHRAHYCAPAGFALEAMCVLCLAGPAAEEYFVGEIIDGGDLIDIEMARGYLAQRFDVLQIGFQLGRARATRPGGW